MTSKPLAQADFETALAFEQELQAAVDAAQEANAAYQRFVAILRKRYDAPADAWTLTDWAVGFERVTADKRPDGLTADNSGRQSTVSSQQSKGTE